MTEPLSIERALDRLPELVDTVITRRERITIATPEGAEAVLMNAEDWAGLEEALEILNDQESVAALKRSVDEAARRPSGRTGPAQPALRRQPTLRTTGSVLESG